MSRCICINGEGRMIFREVGKFKRVLLHVARLF